MNERTKRRLLLLNAFGATFLGCFLVVEVGLMVLGEVHATPLRIIRDLFVVAVVLGMVLSVVSLRRQGVR